MYLTDSEIFKKCTAEDTEPLIDEFNINQLNPCSYDLRIDRNGFLYGDGKKGAVLEPMSFCLASTVETITLPDNLAAQVIGKSTIGRTGLFVQNAGHIDPGFKGQITLELFNAGPEMIYLENIDRIAQIVFIPLTGAVSDTYHGKYQNQKGATMARFNKKETDIRCPVGKDGLT